MSKGCAVACARALAFFAVQREPSVLMLLRRIAWELLYLAPEGTADLALVVRSSDGRLMVGNAREHMALPSDTLKGLVLEHERRESILMVKDHALDGASFIDAAPRSSVSCRIVTPIGLSARRECFLWVGLYAVAHSRIVEEVREISSELAGWFEQYEGVVSAIISTSSRVADLEEKERELAAVLHDVRAPVGGLKYLLTQFPLSAESDATIISSVSQELSYMENLLASLSPAQVDRSRFHLGVCNADDVVRRVVARCRSEGTREGVSIVVDSALRGIGARIPDIELERVLSNILGNAIRYSRAGDVNVTLRCDRNRVVVVVSDTGPGIDPRILAELREPHCRTVSSSSGWGMGLVSSKRRIERYAGELCVASSSERGTTIEIVLPRGPDLSSASPQNEDRAVVGAATEAIDLIIVDDDEQQVAALQRVLGTSGLTVRGATSVAEAATMAASAATKAVLCDATMPDGGALKLIELFKERGINTRIAVASGDGSEDLLYRCAAHGAREFFCKPVDIGPLLSWVRSEECEASAPIPAL
jgi:signal transduction histidine kinase/ActR/RegA family two-component response regulator